MLWKNTRKPMCWQYECCFPFRYKYFCFTGIMEMCRLFLSSDAIATVQKWRKSEQTNKRRKKKGRIRLK